MKKISLTILFCLFASNCFGAEFLVKAQGREIYKVSIGADNDEVIIGDEKNPSIFEPKITFTGWKNPKDNLPENFISIRYNGIVGIPKLSAGQLKVSNIKQEFYCYPVEDGLKFGVNLIKKPTTNKITFYLDGWEEFDFFYQAPLANLNPDGSTWETMDGNGISRRPAEMSGGYAIYHKWKRNNIKDGTKYMVGKFGEFYRPKFIDANNNQVWGELDIKDGVYTVTIPQSFLDNATYPIKSNDQFGRNTKGATEYGGYVDHRFWGTKFSSAPAGQITKAYVAARYSWRTGQYARTAIYDDSNNLIANTDSGNMTITTTSITSDLATWTQATISSGFTMVSGTTYRLAWICNNTDIYMYYDAGGANTGSSYVSQTYSNFPSDPSPTTNWTTTNNWSVCYEYTPSSAASIRNPIINTF